MKNYIFNERLMNKLGHINEYSLIAMEAPAGYGKTTAIRNILAESDRQIFWYTAVESVKDTSFSWFVRQLGLIDDRAAEKLVNLGFLNRSNAAEAGKIISEIRSNSPVTLIFDNFQFSLSNWEPQIIEALARLPENSIQTIFLSQNFGRLKSILYDLEKNICFVRGSELLLEKSDIRKFAEQRELVLSEKEIDQIHKKTDGWAAAVALYLENISEEQDDENEFLYQDIMGLMEDRFWRKLSDSQKKFLMSICMFDRFDERDAEVLIPSDIDNMDEWRILLERSPLIRGPERGGIWFPHEILLNFLREKLEDEEDEFKKGVYVRSAKTYENSRMIKEAVELYFKAGDYEDLLKLPLCGLITEKFGWMSYTDLAERVLRRTPEDIQKKYPLSLLRLCYALYGGCAFEEFRFHMDRIKIMIEEMKDEQLLGEWYLVDAYENFPDVDKMYEKYQMAEDYMDHPSEIFVKEEPFLFGCTSMWYMFYSVPGEMLEIADRLEKCMKLYNKLTNGHGNGAAQLYRGEAYSVQGRFEESDIQAYQAAFLSEQAQNATITYGASLLLGINSIYRSDMTGLGKAVDYLENKAQGYKFLKGKMLNTYMVETVRGYLLGLMMETSRSAIWTQGEADSLTDLTFTNFMIKTCRITDLLLKKEYKMAIASVETSLAMDERLITVPTRNFMYCGLALGYMAIGRLLKAAEYLDKSLELAGQDKNYTFLACFRKYFQVLFMMPNIASKHKETIREIKELDISYTRADESHIFAMLEEVPELGDIADSNELTDREQEVAELAAKGFRNHEIAQKLHISENTVKHHLKIIFQKMNIDRRTKLIEMLS